MTGLYRESTTQDWRAVEIVCALPMNRFLVRETGKVLAGIAVATIDQVRVPGAIFEPVR